MKLKELLQEIDDVQKKYKLSKVFACGGTPRDKLLGRLEKISDLDLTTGDASVKELAVESAITLGKKYHIQMKLSSDGHSTMTFGNLKVDFSSNFNIAGIDNLLIKENIKNPTSLQKEMFSRDFNCNAILLDFDLKTITDPTNKGVSDIKNKIVDTCLNPAVTLTTFPNRVIRSIYLCAKLDFNLHPRVEEWIKKNPISVQNATPKGLSEKIIKALESDKDKTIYLFNKLGLWGFLPMLDELAPYTKNRKQNV